MGRPAALHSQGKSGLFHDPELQIAQSWCEEIRPNESWAEQYGGELEQSLAFLEKSADAAHKTERETEAARQHQLEQAQALAETQRSAARNFKRFAIGMGIVALVAIGAFAYAFVQQKSAEEAEAGADNAKRVAEQLEKKANAKEAQTSQEFAQSDVSISRTFTERGDVGTGIAHLARSLKRAPNQPAVVDRIFNLLAYTAPPEYLSPPLDYGDGPVYATTASQDGSIVATSTPHALKVWSPGSDQPFYWEDYDLSIGGTAIYCGGLILSPDKHLLFVANNNGAPTAPLSHLVDLTSREPRWKVDDQPEPGKKGLVFPRFSEDGRRIIAYANNRHQFALLDLADGTMREKLDWKLASVLSPDGTKNAFLDWKKNLIRIESASGAAPVEVHRNLFPPLWDVGFSPDGERILVGPLNDGARVVYGTETGKTLFSLGDEGADILLPVGGDDHYAQETTGSSCWVFSPEGQFILSVGTDRIVRLWDASTETPGPRLLAKREIPRHVVTPGHTASTHRPIAFSEDGRRFMIATRDGGCYYSEFDRTAPQDLPNLKHSAHVNDGYAFLADGGAIKPLWLPHRDVVAAALAPGGGSLALGSRDGRVAVYDLVTGERHGPGFAPGGPIHSVTFSPDRHRLAAASDNGKVVVWDLAKTRPVGPPIALPEWAGREFESLGFTGDGSGLVIQTGRGKLLEDSQTVISVYDIETGTRRTSNRMSPPLVNDIGLDGSTLLQAWENFLLVSDIESGTVRASIAIPEGVKFAALSPDGSLVAAILSDSSLRLWSALSGETVELAHRAVSPEAEKLRFSEDKQMLAVWGVGTVAALPLVSGSSPVQMALPDSAQVRSLALSGDGRLLAAVVAESEATYGRIWDSRSGEPISDRLAISRSANSVAFLKDARQAVFWPRSPSAGDEPGLATLWDVSVSGGNAGPDWFRGLATSLGGMRLGEKGQIQPVDAEERIAQSGVLAEIDEESPLAKFSRWLLEFPGTRSDSPFRPIPSEAYVETLFEEEDFALIDEVLRIIPPTHRLMARAHARRAALRLVGHEISPATVSLSKADLARARRLEPEDSEIAWYHWMTLAKLGDPTKTKDALTRALRLGDPGDEQILSLVRVHEQLQVGGKEILEMLTRALARGSDKRALELRIKRFELATGTGDLVRAQEDWAILADESALPQLYDSFQLVNIYFNAVHDEAQRLHGIGELDAAVDLLRPVALAKEIMEVAHGDASRVSWLSEMIGWTDPWIQLIAKTSEWRYNDQGVDLGDEWRRRGYVEEADAWKTGRGILGYGYGEVGDSVPRTELSSGPDEKNKPTTTYFRHEFTTAPGDQARMLGVEVLRDDGVVVYLNGGEILRQNMPIGVLAWKSFASGLVGSGEKRLYFPAQVPSGKLRAGKNVIAAEVHQYSLTSSDLGFDLDLTARRHSPQSLLIESLSADGTLETEALKAVPVAHRESRKRDLRFLRSGETEGSATAISENLWQWRYGLLSVTEDDQALKLIDARLAALDFSPTAARRRMAWLVKKEAILVRLGQTEEVEAVQKTILAGPPRDPALNPKFIDLSKFYTASLYDGRFWTNSSSNKAALSMLPETFFPRNGVGFDLRGLIQLNSGIYRKDFPGKSIAGKDAAEAVGLPFPDEQTGITISQKSKALHFLMSCNWGDQPGAEVARFVMHYDDGPPQTMSVNFGEHVGDWWKVGPRSPASSPGWSGSNPNGQALHLSELVWENPHPDETISHIDFISNLQSAAPFLVGITLE
ncbi:MAG: WD40 repeat protein [Verrucomicrobiales bacterium]